MKIFNSIPVKKPKKNKFDLSHEKKLSLMMADLVPIMVQEILPGDSFRVNSEIMIRLAPMIAPVMHRINVFTHSFFVPNRIIWDEWETFITGGEDGLQAPVWPHLVIDDTNKSALDPGTLADYMGLPVPGATPFVGTKQLSALPFRAYAEIYNEYYRDQTLQPKIPYSKGSGAPAPGDFNELTTMRQRCWEKDYFTSALPFTQRGPEVLMPIDAVVDTVYDKSTGLPVAGTPAGHALRGEDVTGDLETTIGGVDHDLEIRGASASTTINELRRAVRLQEWLEKNARGGARYIEQLLSHFGKAPNDARLQRPEYLGGARQPVVISEVLNTAGSTTIDLQPVGEMAGHGISVGKQNGFNRTFEEHGFVITLMSILPVTNYSQGIPRMFSRPDKLDYAWPEFGQLGEQPILNQELYWTTPSATDLNAFGYTPRYSEYKYGISTIHGDFKTSLEFWHLGRKFSALPPLNADFVKADPDDRIFAVTDGTDLFYCHIYHNISAIRPLPYYGVPTL